MLLTHLCSSSGALRCCSFWRRVRRPELPELRTEQKDRGDQVNTHAPGRTIHRPATRGLPTTEWNNTEV